MGYTHKVIEIPIYLGELHLFQGNVNSIKKINKDFKLGWDDVHGYGALAFPFHLENGFTRYGMFFLKSYPNKYTFPKNIVHECCHIKNMIMKDRGMQADLTNDESECYILSWLVEQCYKNLYTKRKGLLLKKH